MRNEGVLELCDTVDEDLCRCSTECERVAIPNDKVRIPPYVT